MSAESALREVAAAAEEALRGEPPDWESALRLIAELARGAGSPEGSRPVPEGWTVRVRRRPDLGERGVEVAASGELGRFSLKAWFDATSPVEVRLPGEEARLVAAEFGRLEVAEGAPLAFLWRRALDRMYALERLRRAEAQTPPTTAAGGGPPPPARPRLPRRRRRIR